MKRYVNGVFVDMTAEEVEAVRREKDSEQEQEQKQEPTVDERMSYLEASNAELREALDLLLSGGTE